MRHHPRLVTVEASIPVGERSERRWRDEAHCSNARGEPGHGGDASVRGTSVCPRRLQGVWPTCLWECQLPQGRVRPVHIWADSGERACPWGAGKVLLVGVSEWWAGATAPRLFLWETFGSEVGLSVQVGLWVQGPPVAFAFGSHSSCEAAFGSRTY
jgi:hypothetical protein